MKIIILIIIIIIIIMIMIMIIIIISSLTEKAHAMLNLLGLQCNQIFFTAS